jgi:hypothetical protein
LIATRLPLDCGSRASPLAAAVVFLLVGAAPRSTRAQVEECRKRGLSKITIIGHVDAQFLVALDQACRSLQGEDLDASVELQISAENRDVVLRAALPDGRRATRYIRDPTQLELALGALATKPPQRPEPNHEQSSTSQPSAIADRPPTQAPARVQLVPHERRLSLEIGAGASLHVAGTPTALAPSISAYAGLFTGQWLGTLTVRWDPLQVLTTSSVSGVEMESAGAGFTVLRSFTSAPVRFDAGIEALLLLETQSVEANDGEHAATGADFRLGVTSRALFGRNNPRWTLSLSANASPARLRRELRLDPLLPPLPQWEVGMGVGASWSEL